MEDLFDIFPRKPISLSDPGIDDIRLILEDTTIIYTHAVRCGLCDRLSIVFGIGSFHKAYDDIEAVCYRHMTKECKLDQIVEDRKKIPKPKSSEGKDVVYIFNVMLSRGII